MSLRTSRQESRRAERKDMLRDGQPVKTASAHRPLVNVGNAPWDIPVESCSASICRNRLLTGIQPISRRTILYQEVVATN